MEHNGYLMTGRRCFGESDVQSIDLWATDSQAEILLSNENGIRKVLLDEGETEVIRRWADLGMQSAIAASQCELLVQRCALQTILLDAAKLNRAASRDAARARKSPAKVAKAGQVVDIAVFKGAQRQEQPAVEPDLAIAA